MISYPIRIPVLETTQVGEARRGAVHLATSLGFDEQQRGEVALVVTEIATNLALHAKKGELIFRQVNADSRTGIEIIAIDRGPGMDNLADALRDGFSTSGTSGNGLGAAQRFSNVFDVHTSAAGSVIVSQIWSQAIESVNPLEIGAVCLPMHPDDACGDSWCVEHTDSNRTIVLVADGLGHGLQAADASREAVRLFQENLHLDGPNLVELMHAGLRSTRGAAVAVVEILRDVAELRFTGIGNISGSLLIDGAMRSAVSHNGTVGAQIHRIKEFVYPWKNGGLLVLHSDGLSSHWQIPSYPGLISHHSSVIAAVLYRDFRRERDDVTVLVIADKLNPA